MIRHILTLILGIPALVPAQEVPAPALRGLDPVELCQNREVAGTPEFRATSGRYRYQFISDSNRNLFDSAPDKYGIQFDGYCMRMGPLTGFGAPDRWYVHDGRIYLFASDACRNRFKSNPEKFIDRSDPLPTGSTSDSARVRQLMVKATEAIGGSAKLDSLDSYRVKVGVAQTYNDKVYRHSRETVVAFPASCRLVEDYGTSVYGWKLIDSHAWVYDDSSIEVDPLVCDFMTREVYRHPLVILKAWQRGDGTFVYQGPDTVGGSQVEKVAFAHAGATTVLSISEESGDILAASYIGRSGPGIGQVMRVFSDFRTVDGMTVPFGLTTRFEGELTAGVEFECEYWKFNQPDDRQSLQ